MTNNDYLTEANFVLALGSVLEKLDALELNTDTSELVNLVCDDRFRALYTRVRDKREKETKAHIGPLTLLE